ncbi:MAG: hypothetical protein PSX80_17190 [bacterium]|nr:hypothetical protein [bacterium]
MNLSSFLIPLIFVAGGASAYGQPQPKAVSTPAVVYAGKATAAYAEIALKRADVEADLESLLVEYTDEFPKVKELKFALTRVDAEGTRLGTIKAVDRDRATVALGKLMVRKVEAEIELWKVQQDYADVHPDVKRARKKVEIYERAIKEILG